MATLKARRLYQVWNGSNRFFFGGRLIFGPDVASVFLSTLLIAFPSFAFCCQVVLKIYKYEIHGGFPHSHILGFPVLFFGLFFTIADLVFLFLTSGRDPGIVPRNKNPPESDEAYDNPTPSMEWINGSIPNIKLPRTKDVYVNDIIVKVKYCDTCLLYRPPRASHCSICNNCVRKFDHHCPWVGQCIGVRNYPFFFLFITSSTLLCIYVFAFSWLNVVEEKKIHGLSLWVAMKGEPLSLVLIAYTFIAVWFVGGLTLFHLYLISINQTTYENFRYRYDKKENPYDIGVLENFSSVFFSRIPPSLNDFRSWVAHEEDRMELCDSERCLDGIGRKEKFDFETGGKRRPDGDDSMPEILRNLDYGAIDDGLKAKNGGGEDGEDSPFAFPIVQSVSIDPNQCCMASDSLHPLHALRI